MTTIAAINWGRYALLATDDRVMVRSGDEWHSETSQKIFKTGYGGWMVGTGLEKLVHATAAELSECPKLTKLPHLVKYLEHCIIGTREKYRDVRDYSEVARKAFDSTRFFFSVVVKGKTQVLIYSPDRREEGLCGYCKPGEIILSAPDGAPDVADVAWQQDLRKRLRPLNAFSSHLESANYHSRILGSYVMRVSEYFPSVSRSGIIGVHTANGTLQAKRFPKGADGEQVENVFLESIAQA